MKGLGGEVLRLGTRLFRNHVVGPDQPWAFEPPDNGWRPAPMERTSLYLHIPFCKHNCPYCPYTKVPFRPSLVEDFLHAALAEIDWWAEAVGPTEVTSVYVGGGTPTLVMNGVARLLVRIRERFHVTGEVCIETNPADVNGRMVQELKQAGVSLVSLGVQSFHSRHLGSIGRSYTPEIAEAALEQLTDAGFSSVNADLMFALPGETETDVEADLRRAADLGADQITAYPLFTFPFTTVGRIRRLKSLKMPNLRARRSQYRTISRWCESHGFHRVSVWGFKRGRAPRYSSVTRHGYLGIGPGAGSHLPESFVFNTFDLASWVTKVMQGRPAVALHLPFTERMAGWWWLYWRLYETRVPLGELDRVMGDSGPQARRWLNRLKAVRLARVRGDFLELSEPGAFWVHLAQNYFALQYVDTLWTTARREPWPGRVSF
jgi:oxygen-independent coproporphyrinogen-3 oxidase